MDAPCLRLPGGPGGIGDGRPADRRTVDRQRSRVYRWEDRVVVPGRDQPLTLDACRRLVETVYRWAEADCVHTPGWAPPIVGCGRGRRYACGSRAVIELPRWARTAPIVLHECAHGLAPDQHGPCFVAVYVALLERFLGLDGAMLRASLAAERIRCGKVFRTSQGGLRVFSVDPVAATARRHVKPRPQIAGSGASSPPTAPSR